MKNLSIAAIIVVISCAPALCKAGSEDQKLGSALGSGLISDRITSGRMGRIDESTKAGKDQAISLVRRTSQKPSRSSRRTIDQARRRLKRRRVIAAQL